MIIPENYAELVADAKRYAKEYMENQTQMTDAEFAKIGHHVPSEAETARLRKLAEISGQPMKENRRIMCGINTE